jgi:hypothetical protein
LHLISQALLVNRDGMAVGNGELIPLAERVGYDVFITTY